MHTKYKPIGGVGLADDDRGPCHEGLVEGLGSWFRLQNRLRSSAATAAAAVHHGLESRFCRRTLSQEEQPIPSQAEEAAGGSAEDWGGGTRIRRLQPAQALAATGCFTPHPSPYPTRSSHSLSHFHTPSLSLPRKSTTGLSDNDLLLGLDVDTK